MMFRLPTPPDSRFLVIAAFLFGTIAANLAAQDTHDWNEPSGGVYSTFTFWTPAGIPSSLDHARFLVDDAYAVSFIQNRSAVELVVGNGGQVTFQGAGIFGTDDHTYEVGQATIALGSSLTLERLGSDRDLNMDVLDDLVVVGTLSVLESAQANSAVSELDSGSPNFTALARIEGTQNGERSVWDASDLTVGIANRGRLSVHSGGLVRSNTAIIAKEPNSFGDVIVAGESDDGATPSAWISNLPSEPMVVGERGRGLMGIQSGAIVESASVELGKFFGGEGEVTVSGTNGNGVASSWFTRDLKVGVGGDFGGSGTLTIENGGFVSSTNGYIGMGDAIIRGMDAEGEPSAWIADELTVGDVRTSAAMRLSDGGYLSSSTTYVARHSSPGSISLASRGSERTVWDNFGNVFIGGDPTAAGGVGQLSIGSESTVNISETLKVWNTSEVEITLGTLNARRIDLANGAVFDFQGGRLQFEDFDGDLTNQGGILAPGPGPSTMQIEGEYRQQQNAALEIEIAGLQPGVSYDRVDVFDLASIGGELRLELTGGFRPEPSDELTVMVARLISGVFDNAASGERLATVDGGGSFVVNYGVGSPFDPNLVVLSDFMAIAGPDFNGDGVADCLDIDALVADIAVGMNTSTYDLTGDGVVNSSDLTEWLAQAGAMNLASGNSYLHGDANLDGSVDGLDFIDWNENKFTALSSWCGGDFDADGLVDGLDFILWNSNKFASANSTLSAVPEPTIGLLFLCSASGLAILRFRKR